MGPEQKSETDLVTGGRNVGGPEVPESFENVLDQLLSGRPQRVIALDSVVQVSWDSGGSLSGMSIRLGSGDGGAVHVFEFPGLPRKLSADISDLICRHKKGYGDLPEKVANALDVYNARHRAQDRYIAQNTSPLPFTERVVGNTLIETAWAQLDFCRTVRGEHEQRISISRRGISKDIFSLEIILQFSENEGTLVFDLKIEKEQDHIVHRRPFGGVSTLRSIVDEVIGLVCLNEQSTFEAVIQRARGFPTDRFGQIEYIAGEIADTKVLRLPNSVQLLLDFDFPIVKMSVFPHGQLHRSALNFNIDLGSCVDSTIHQLEKILISNTADNQSELKCTFLKLTKDPAVTVACDPNVYAAPFIRGLLEKVEPTKEIQAFYAFDSADTNLEETLLRALDGFDGLIVRHSEVEDLPIIKIWSDEIGSNVEICFEFPNGSQVVFENIQLRADNSFGPRQAFVWNVIDLFEDEPVKAYASLCELPSICYKQSNQVPIEYRRRY